MLSGWAQHQSYSRTGDGGACGDVMAGPKYGQCRTGGRGGGMLKVSSQKDMRLSGRQEMNEQLLLAAIPQRSEDIRS